MIFNSSAYLLFYLTFLLIYWGSWGRISLNFRNILILAASYFFYGSWDVRFLSLIVISSVVDYGVGIALGKAKKPNKRKLLLGISLTVNLGMLGLFKYYNFFVDSFARLLQNIGLSPSLSSLEIILPVGISFYTFQTLSYTIDIYRKQLEPTRDFWAFLSFVAFFPQLVAGPIERAKRLLPQFLTQQNFDEGRVISGFRLILWGFFKKIVIADNLAPLVDLIFSNPEYHNPAMLLLGGVLFAFQIYGDFSGYSDIAIGTARTLGFDLSTNFRTPYFSRGLAEFWQRWHISLSTWFRDYVYIPLGGNRVKEGRWMFNILVTFVVSGLWHGANLVFLIWGFLHGFSLIIEKRIKEFGTFEPSKFVNLLLVALTFLLVSIFWIPFRAGSDLLFFEIINNAINTPPSLVGIGELVDQAMSGTKIYYFVFTFMLFISIEWKMGLRDFHQFIQGKPTAIRYGSYYLLLILIILLGNFNLAPNFIYFQF